jgi:hypothetical protein
MNTIRLGGRARDIESILECIPQGIVVANREGRIVLFNDAARRILGAGPVDVPLEAWSATYGLFLPDQVTPYPHDQLPLVRAIRGEPVIDAEIFVRHSTAPEGTSIIVNGTPWNDVTGVLQGGIAVLRDVTPDRRSRHAFSSGPTITSMRNAGHLTPFVSVGKGMADRAAIEDRDVEMRLAGLVQKRLYPPVLRRQGIDIAGAAHPANATGGDYYDYLHMPEGRLGIVVADVSGHGLGAALIMVATRAALRSCADMGISLDEILDRVNATLLGDIEADRFVTMFLASLDARARSLTYSSAGHPPGYVLDRDGEIKHVMDSTRIPLGIMADWRGQPTRSIPLEPGDIMVFLTDGILESLGAGGHAFGVQPALALVKEHRLEPAQRILERLLEAVHASRRGVPQDDDMTAVICKVEGMP